MDGLLLRDTVVCCNLFLMRVEGRDREVTLVQTDGMCDGCFLGWRSALSRIARCCREVAASKGVNVVVIGGESL